MKAAVLSRPFHIRFGGSTDFQYVADTAAAFIACADGLPEGAHVFNLHGETVEIAKIARMINELASAELVTFAGPPIPIAPTMSDVSIRRIIGEIPATSLRIGVQQTMELFSTLRDAGRLVTTDLDV
jgi:nucleoside-diphosphate-sugar epimerase